MPNACFWMGLDHKLFQFLFPGHFYIPLVDFINDVLWLNGSDFFVKEIKEDNINHHPAAFRKHLSAPAHPKPVSKPSTDSAPVTIRTAYSAFPGFPQAQKALRKFSIPQS